MAHTPLYWALASCLPPHLFTWERAAAALLAPGGARRATSCKHRCINRAPNSKGSVAAGARRGAPAACVTARGRWGLPLAPPQARIGQPQAWSSRKAPTAPDWPSPGHSRSVTHRGCVSQARRVRMPGWPLVASEWAWPRAQVAAYSEVRGLTHTPTQRSCAACTRTHMSQPHALRGPACHSPALTCGAVRQRHAPACARPLRPPCVAHHPGNCILVRARLRAPQAY